MAKVTRVDRMAAARAAGLRGEDPGPAWLGDYADDPGIMEAYEQGLAEHQATAEGRSPRGAKSRKASRGSGTTTPGGARKSPSGDSGPSGPPSGGNPGPPPSARVISMPSDTAHDLAGVLVGAVAVAFLINVLHGTWKQWLRAKFLNDTTGTAAKSAPPSTAATPPSYPINPGTATNWSFLNPSSNFTPTPALPRTH